MAFGVQNLSRRVTPEERWLPFRRSPTAARVRLFCFHHAGGNALLYRSWTRELPEWIDVCPLQLPGRNNRMDESPIVDMNALVESFVSDLASFFDIPIAVFGHSMGAAVAYAVARRLGPIVTQVFVSARSAPNERGTPRLHTLNDDGLERYLRSLGGTPDVVLDDPGFRAHVLSVLRADLTLNGEYRESRPLIATPITAFGGFSDRLLTPEKLDTWRALTDARFRKFMFAGGHFFVVDSRAAVQRHIVETLEVVA